MRQFFLISTILLPFYVSGQLLESFDGPEVTSTYPWQGNTECFIINADNELQLKGSSMGGEEKLFLSAVPLYDNEWHGKARSEYRGTTGNYFRFFLWCEKPDLDMPGDAIYVRMGYSKYSITLCYQRGNMDKTVLIEGRELFTEPREVEFRVTIDAEGNAVLYSRCSDELEFYEEGTAEIPIYADEPGYYMLGVKYSSQHARDKYIDELYIKNFELQGEEEPEEEEPALVFEAVEQENGEELLIHFNRPVVAEAASFVLSELGEADTVYQSYDKLTLKLIWIASREKGKAYTLYYDMLFDTEGNVYEGEYTFNSLFGPTETEPEPTEEPENPLPEGCLRFNEIMADPNGLSELPQTEYVELYNASEQTIDLNDWTFVYGDTRVALAEMDFPADSYLVLYREGREITLGEGAVSMPLAKFPAQLANTGKTLQLLDPSGAVVDAVTYEEAKAGQAWEWSATGWFLSTDTRGGTPGSANSTPSGDPEDPTDPEDPEDPTDPEDPENPTEPEEPEESEVEPFDILFNELLPNPYPEGSEYIELYNRSGYTQSLRGLSIAVRKSDGTFSTIYSLSTVAAPLASGDYALLTKDDEGVYPYYSVPYPENVHKLKLPILNNTGSTLVLFRTSDQVVIDEVCYSAQWHHTSIRQEKGVALERIDPEGETQDKKNWTSAAENANYGTPGYQNSQYLRQPKEGEDPTSITKPDYSHQTGLYSILYALDQPGYRCRAFIYSISGKRVAEIANNELMGTSGSLTWDGAGYQQRKLSPGPYIFYLELYHGKGLVKTYKEVFLVY